MVENASVRCGSKCTGGTCERSRNRPPRFGLWASAGPAVTRPAVAPRARPGPPRLRRSRRGPRKEPVDGFPLVNGFLAIDPGAHRRAAVIVSEIRAVVDERSVPYR